MADIKKLLESFDRIGEAKTKDNVPAPRNVVAKNAKTSGAGQHKNPREIENTRKEKHKKDFLKDLHEAEKDTRTLRRIEEAYNKFKEDVDFEFDAKLASILKARGYKGPIKLEQMGRKWIKALGHIVDIDDGIMVKGRDPEYDGWVAYVYKMGQYAYGAEQGYQTGNAQSVEKNTRDQGMAEGLRGTGNPGMPRPYDQGKEDAKKGRSYDNPYDQPGEEHEHNEYKKGYQQGKQQGVAEGSLNEFAPDGFTGGDDDEGFSPEIAKMAQEDGFTKGVSLADGATLERAITINYWHSQHGGMYKQYFVKGFKAGRMNKIKHDNERYNLNLKLMKDGSIRRGEQGVAEAGPFSYGAKKPRKGSVADLAAKKRKEQEKDKQPAEPRDQRVGVAKVLPKDVEEGSESSLKSATMAAWNAVVKKHPEWINNYGSNAVKRTTKEIVRRHWENMDQDNIDSILFHIEHELADLAESAGQGGAEGFERFQVGDKISFPLSQMATGVVDKIDDKRLYVKLDNGEVYTIPSTMLHSVKLLERQGVAESLRTGEYYLYKIYFDDGTTSDIEVTSDEFDFKSYYAKKGKNVVKVERQGGIRSDYAEGMTEESDKCPPATQDIKLNLENRQKAIDEYGYGPLNPALPNTKFWMQKVKEWKLDSAEEAKQSLCGNCAAFDIRQKTLDCIAQGIDSEDPYDASGVIEAGELGYCKFLKFKCASKRTCDAWVTGGPLTDNKDVNESDISGLLAASKLNKSFIITANLAEGGRKKFRVKAQSERTALEKFKKHHAMAKIVDIKQEEVKEATTSMPTSPTAPTSATSAGITSATQQKPLNLQAVQQQLKIPGNPMPGSTTGNAENLAAQAVIQKALAGKPLDSAENNLYHSLLQKAIK